jgi:phage terminase small subunit
MAVDRENKITPKEAHFLAEYLIDKNGARAAVAAGYSVRSAKEIAYVMLLKPKLKRAMAKMLKEQQSRALITADQVLRDIERISAKAEGAGEYHAAIRGKELLGKHYKLFTEKHEHGGIGGGAIQLTISEQDEAL